MKIKGVKLFPWQRAVADKLKVPGEYGRNSGTFHTILSRRQCGKSILIENILLYFGFNYSKTTSILVSPTLAQSRKVFKDIVDTVSKAPGVIKKKNETLLEIRFSNGSEILFKSAEQRDALRGLTVSGVLCIDEAAYISDEVFNLLLPTTDVNRAPIVIVSTPRFKEGFFYTYYERGMQGTKGCYSYSFNDFDTTALLSPERLETYRQTLPHNQFLTEYLGQFLDSESILFGDFKLCCNTGIPSPGSKRFMGIDWGAGKGEDYTVVSIINELGEQVYMERWNDKNTSQTIDRVSDIISAYKPSVIYSENNSIGKPYNDLLEDRKIKVYRWETTNKSKNDLVSALQVAFEQRQIKILPIDIQLRELASYQMEFNPKTKTITYNAPSGLNDDTVMALMLSWMAKKEGNTSGVYNMSFIKGR